MQERKTTRTDHQFTYYQGRGVVSYEGGTPRTLSLFTRIVNSTHKEKLNKNHTKDKNGKNIQSGGKNGDCQRLL
jgi:hypothetical protein